MATGKDLGALIGQLGADIRQWEQAFDQMETGFNHLERQGAATARRLTESLDQAGRRMQQMGRQMTTRITAPIVGLGALAVREFGNFDAAMTQSTAIMGSMSSAMRTEMEEAARAIGRTTTLSATEAAESYFFLASAGLDAQSSIAALPQVAAFAQAGMFDMATATDLATDSQAALGLTSEDTQKNLHNLTRVTDVLVKANTLANASVEQFSTALTREAGAALRSFNIDMEEGVAVLAAFADQGVKGELAGSSLSRVLRLVTSAAVNNKDAMNELGLEVFDAEGNIRNMADIVENLEDALDGMSDSQRIAALESIGFSARVQGVILPLLGTSDAIRTYESELRQAGGTTQDVADNQLEAFNTQLGLLWDNVRDIGIAFGQTLEPALRRLVSLAQDVAENFQNMSEGARIEVLKIAGLLAASGPLLMALGIAARVIAGFAALVMTKFTLIAGAFVLGVGAGQWFVDNLEAFGERIRRQVDSWQISFSDGFSSIAEKAVAFAARFGPGIGGALGRVTDEALMTQQGLGEVQTEITSFADSLSRGMSMLGNFTMEMTGANRALALFESLFERAADTPEDATKGMEDFSRSVEGVSLTGGNLSTRLQQLSGDIIENAEAAEGTRPAYDDMTEGAVELGQALQTTAISAITDFSESIGDAFTGDGGAEGFFDNILLIVVNFAQQLGRLLIAAGVASEAFRNLLVNPAAAIIAGGALIAASTAVRNLLQQGPTQKVNDALITSDGKVIEFHRDDNILAMQDMSGLGSMGQYSKPQNMGSSVSGGGESAGDQIEKGFERALDKKLSKLGPSEIFVLAQMGRGTF